MSADRTIGNYVLGPLIGRGGMSEVYAAQHRFLGDPVAIKLLRSHLASDDAAIAGFIAEATRTRAIEHPNVVRVLDFGSAPEGFYLVMERLEGETLAARLARGPLAEPEARRIGAAIADGVAAAHERGIVHRDLKPGNVVLVDDVPKIVDFGIARYYGGEAPTTTGSRIGTPAYMAPEQLTGGLVAPCVDVFALGVILYEMVTGDVPFDVSGGKSPQLVAPAPRLARVSPAYAALVAACLEREPGKRPAHLHEVAQALRDRAPGDRITEDVPELVIPPVPLDRGYRKRLVLAGTVLGLLAVIALVWHLYHRADVPHPTADAQTVSITTPEPAPADAALVAPPAVDAATALSVDVRSTPAGAEIFVGGKQVGTTPDTIELDGPATLVITRHGYEPLHIWADRPGPIDVKLAPVPRANRQRVKKPAGEGLD